MPSPARPTVEAGRELDARIAVEVMGWRRKKIRVGKRVPGEEEPVRWMEDGIVSGIRYHTFNPEVASDLPPYSTDISAAMQVVEKLIERGAVFSICSHGVLPGMAGTAFEDECRWEVEIVPRDGATVRTAFATAPTLPLAICLAALRTLDSEVQDHE